MRRPDGAGAPAWAGVDTHKDTNALALLDATGRVVGTWEFPTGEEGYAALAARIGDTSVPVGVEGVRSYGAGLAAHLEAAGFEVWEVVRPSREQRRRGKTDASDAVAAAQNLAAGRALRPKELAGAAADVRCLLVARELEVRHMTAVSNAVDAMLVTAPQRVRDAYGPMRREERMDALARSRAKGELAESLRALARAWRGSAREARRLELRMRAILLEGWPELMGADGVGTVSAARIVAAAGSNPERMGGEAAFSMLCGTSPLPASSGKVARHRLNRGGDRQANRAIHEIARARMARDPRTQAYIAKKTSEGMSVREAVRCLCRYIAREVYRLLTRPQVPLPDGAELASRRRAAGLTQADVAETLGVNAAKVSRAERRVEFSAKLLRAYDSLLEEIGGTART